MDSFLNSMTSSQALEWELFAQENLSFEEELLYQIAHIAQVFASAFIQKKDKGKWALLDFMPFRNKKKKPIMSKSLLEDIKGIVRLVGDEKTKKRLLKEEETPKVQGTDGKWYKYALEEFATRTSPPKRKAAFRQPVKGSERKK